LRSDPGCDRQPQQAAQRATIAPSFRDQSAGAATPTARGLPNRHHEHSNSRQPGHGMGRHY
jgi:hypothetical protein